MKEVWDNNKVCATVFTDLAKAFHCLLHDFLIAKLQAFDFDFKLLRVTNEHLNDRIYITKIGSFYNIERFFNLRCPTRLDIRRTVI